MQRSPAYLTAFLPAYAQGIYAFGLREGDGLQVVNNVCGARRVVAFYVALRFM